MTWYSASRDFPDFVRYQNCSIIGRSGMDGKAIDAYDSLKSYLWLYASFVTVNPIIAIFLIFVKEEDEFLYIVNVSWKEFFKNLYISLLTVNIIVLVYASICISQLSEDNCDGDIPIIVIARYMTFEFFSLILPVLFYGISVIFLIFYLVIYSFTQQYIPLGRN